MVSREQQCAQTSVSPTFSKESCKSVTPQLSAETGRVHQVQNPPNREDGLPVTTHAEAVANRDRTSRASRWLHLDSAHAPAAQARWRSAATRPRRTNRADLREPRPPPTRSCPKSAHPAEIEFLSLSLRCHAFHWAPLRSAKAGREY